MMPFVVNGLFCTPNVSKNSQMLQPFTRTLNFRIISISLEFSKNETATVSRPYSVSAVSWAKKDGFEKFKIMVVCLDLTMENDEKQNYLLLIFYEFEKLANYLLSMNLDFLLFAGKCRVDQF